MIIDLIILRKKYVKSVNLKIKLANALNLIESTE